MSVGLISLFAGVGGFDLAASNLGFETLAAVELDKAARGVLAARFPNVALYDDVRTVDGGQLRNGFVGRTVLAAGFPCQDLSTAGKRAGLAGSRSGLFWEIPRIADECRADALLLENVAGLLSSNRGRDFALVVGALAECGYSVGWRVLDAKYFGVPQRRRRVFIVAARVGSDRLAEVLFECDSGGGDLAPRRKARQGVAAGVADGVGSGSERVGNFELYDFPSGPVSPTLNAQRAKDCITWDDGGPVLMRQREGKPGGGKGPLLSSDISLTIATSNDQVLFANNDAVAYSIREDAGAGTFSANEIDTSVALQAVRPSVQSHHAQTFITQTVAAYDELNHAIAETHQTLRAGTKQSTGAVVGTVVRRLTPVECERLQGFPDGWTATRVDEHTGTLVEQKDSARYKQMGNAVAVPCVEWVLGRLVTLWG